MKTRKNFRKWLSCCGAASAALLLPALAFAESPKDDGDRKVEPGEHVVVTKPDATTTHSPTTNSHTAPPPGSDERADMMQQNPRFVMDTISEEKTEIAALQAQAMQLRKLGGSKNRKIANLLDRMRHEHEAAGPGMMKLAKSLGADPSTTKVMMAPKIGSPMEMLHAAHMDHAKAVQMSQMRWGMSNSPKVRAAMHKRGNLARKHMRWMTPYHSAKNCPMCADMMENGTMMKDGMKHNTHGMKTM